MGLRMCCCWQASPFAADTMEYLWIPVRWGHSNPSYSVDFSRVYVSLIDGWLGSSSRAVLGDAFSGFDFFRI